jgi:SAM-dependent methyltransferase
MDDFSEFKAMQRKAWALFAGLEMFTTPPAAKLVAFARLHSGQRVLDVASGTGVVAVTAARAGARVTAVDLTPELIEVARHNAQLAGVAVEWREGDVEALPFEANSFDAVLSQFGHMFAPRPEVAAREMIRVLKPGGVIAFSTWPPELFIGRMYMLIARYLPPPPPGASPPPQWGDVAVIRERLESQVKDLSFERGTMLTPALSPAHYRAQSERYSGSVRRFVGTAQDPAKLAEFRREFDALIAEYFHENLVRQDFLMTRALKA